MDFKLILTGQSKEQMNKPAAANSEDHHGEEEEDNEDPELD